MLNKKVLIFGAGIAGLSTAYYLRKEGCQPVVYEKRPDAGGRFATLEYEGVYINKGAMMFAPALNPHFTGLIGNWACRTSLSGLKNSPSR